MSRHMVFLLCSTLAISLMASNAAFGLDYDIRIANGMDDVEQHLSSGDIDPTSSDLEFPYEDDGNPPSDEQISGLRFIVPIPKEAEILKAHLEFEIDETKGNTGPVNLIIEGQLILNAPPFEDVANNVTDRAPWTEAKVKWTIPTGLGVDAKFQSPDISAIIQEIIGQDGWVADNAMVIAIRDDPDDPSAGIRCVESHNGESGSAGLLHIEIYNPTASRPNPADGSIGVTTPLLEWTAGDEAIFHDVYVGTSPELTEADLAAARQPFTMHWYIPGLTPGGTYYWRVDEVAMDGTVHTGTVWSFVAQDLIAYYPVPADGVTDVSTKPTLTWQAGQAVVKHHVYLGDDLDAVTQGAAGTDQGETEETSLAPDELEAATTYYWRVDEIAFGDEVRTGDVWSFTTVLPVDDFESYTDDEGSRIYEIWIDGWTNGTGSVVGNLTAPFAEQTIVHGGLQSMPVEYNNVDPPNYSEAELAFTPTQDWTINGVDTLILYVRGQASNGAAPLSVTLEDSSGGKATVFHPDEAIVNKSSWTKWSTPLADFADVNAGRIKTIYITLGDRDNPTPGGAGRIYIDDIGVAQSAPPQ